MQIKLLFVGGIKKNNRISDLLADYQKRIKRRLRIELIFVKEYKLDDIKTKLKKESTEIQAKIENTDLNIVLDEKGKQLTSIQFSKLIEQNMQISKNICFIIGGAYGLDAEFKSKFQKISLSKLTLQHDIAVLILFEQLYRAVSIIYNEPYHK